MTRQRRRGTPVKLYKSVQVMDNRMNKTFQYVPVNPHEVRAAVIPQRGGRAEVPGQQEIDVVRLILPPDLEDVNLWSRAEFQGRQWDVVSPPQIHEGTRRTRHISVDVRGRGETMSG